MKKFLTFTLLALLVVIGLVVYNAAHHATIGAITSAPIEPWQPAQLRIPALGIDAPVMNVGRNAQGLMDAPVSQAINSPYWSRVFWYSPGPAPGQAGNAVIAGHVDRVGGDPAIFWSLHTMKAGDAIDVTMRNGQKLHFVVDRVVSYPASTSDSETLDAIFGPATGHHLNLITCSGAWTGHGYDQRLVVFSTQVS